MDPAAALLLLTLQPVRMDPQAAVLRGAFLPVVLPIDALPPATRAAWLLDATAVAPGRRVAALMEAGRHDDAFLLTSRLNQPVTGAIATALGGWGTRERERLGLPATEGAVVVLPGAEAEGLTPAAILALNVVITSLPLPWPRWTGPLVVMGPEVAADPIPGHTWLARPVLPLLRCNAVDRARIAADLVGLVLALGAPPAQGWPPWLRQGLAGLCARRADGRTASPRQLRADRQEAGAAGLRTLLGAGQPDMALAMAVCAPLIQPEHRARFLALMDLLRNGATSEGALRVAYGWTLADLADLR